MLRLPERFISQLGRRPQHEADFVGLLDGLPHGIVNALTDLRRIDEYRRPVHPVLHRGGKPWVHTGQPPTATQHLSTSAFSSDVAVIKYRTTTPRSPARRRRR